MATSSLENCAHSHRHPAPSALGLVQADILELAQSNTNTETVCLECFMERNATTEPVK